MRKISGIILIVLGCLVVLFTVADKFSFQKHASNTGAGEKLGFAINTNEMILSAALLVLAVFLFIRGGRLLKSAGDIS